MKEIFSLFISSPDFFCFTLSLAEGFYQENKIY